MKRVGIKSFPLVFIIYYLFMFNKETEAVLLLKWTLFGSTVQIFDSFIVNGYKIEWNVHPEMDSFFSASKKMFDYLPILKRFQME